MSLAVFLALSWGFPADASECTKLDQCACLPKLACVERRSVTTEWLDACVDSRKGTNLHIKCVEMSGTELAGLVKRANQAHRPKTPDLKGINVKVEDAVIDGVVNFGAHGPAKKLEFVNTRFELDRDWHERQSIVWTGTASLPASVDRDVKPGDKAKDTKEPSSPVVFSLASSFVEGSVAAIWNRSREFEIADTEIVGGLVLDGSKIEQLSLTRARVKGDYSCRGCTVTKHFGIANTRFEGDVILDDTHFPREHLSDLPPVTLAESNVRGRFSCDQCEFPGDVHAQGANFGSEVSFEGGSSGSGTLDFAKSRFERGASWIGVTGCSRLLLDGVNAGGTLRVSQGVWRSIALGSPKLPVEVDAFDLSRAKIGQLSIADSYFRGRVRVLGNVFEEPCKDVRAIAPEASEDRLRIENTTFVEAVRIQNNKLSGSVVLRNTTLTQELVLSMPRLGEELDVSGLDWDMIDATTDSLAPVVASDDSDVRVALNGLEASFRNRGDLKSANVMLYASHWANMNSNWDAMTGPGDSMWKRIKALATWIWDGASLIFSGFATSIVVVACWLLSSAIGLGGWLWYRKIVVLLPDQDTRPVGVWPTLREGPSAFLTHSAGQSDTSLAAAMRLGFAIVMKIPLSDAYVHADKDAAPRRVVTAVWILGAVLLAYGAITLKNTQPIVHLLVAGAFG